MRHITIPRKSSRSAVRQPVLAALSATRYPDVPMSIRRCASQVRQTRQCPLRTPCGASFPRKSWCAARRAAIRPTATRLGLRQDLSRKSTIQTMWQSAWKLVPSWQQRRGQALSEKILTPATSSSCSADGRDAMAAAVRQVPPRCTQRRP